MGYAFLEQRREFLQAHINMLQVRQGQVSDIHLNLATQQGNLKQQMNSLTTGQALALKPYYEDLSDAESSDERESINAEIKAIEQEFKAEQDEINRQVYEIGIKEQVYDNEQKRLATQVEKESKELETLEQAVKTGVDNATPKFNGLG